MSRIIIIKNGVLLRNVETSIAPNAYMQEHFGVRFIKKPIFGAKNKGHEYRYGNGQRYQVYTA